MGKFHSVLDCMPCHRRYHRQIHDRILMIVAVHAVEQYMAEVLLLPLLREPLWDREVRAKCDNIASRSSRFSHNQSSLSSSLPPSPFAQQHQSTLFVGPGFLHEKVSFGSLCCVDVLTISKKKNSSLASWFLSEWSKFSVSVIICHHPSFPIIFRGGAATRDTETPRRLYPRSPLTSGCLFFVCPPCAPQPYASKMFFQKIERYMSIQSPFFFSNNR